MGSTKYSYVQLNSTHLNISKRSLSFKEEAGWNISEEKNRSTCSLAFHSFLRYYSFFGYWIWIIVTYMKKGTWLHVCEESECMLA